MTQNPYWLVSGLSYEDTLKLASADCVENFQRDAQSGETKFWPGTAEVFNHLYRNTEPGQMIAAADGSYLLAKERCKIAVTS